MSGQDQNQVSSRRGIIVRPVAKIGPNHTRATPNDLISDHRGSPVQIRRKWGNGIPARVRSRGSRFRTTRWSLTPMLLRILNHPWFFWLLLALPAAPMVAGLASGASAESLLHPSGEFAARFLIIALIVTPLGLLFRHAGWTRWLMRRRRALGVAAFGYAAFHTMLYIVDMGSLRDMLAEFWALGIWTGWAAFAIFLPLAITSNDWAMRRLRRAWQPLHRWVYPAALLTLVHWIFVHNNLGPALVHFAPLALLQGYRVLYRLRRARPKPA